MATGGLGNLEKIKVILEERVGLGFGLGVSGR